MAKFSSRFDGIVEAEQFIEDRAGLPFQNVAPVCCFVAGQWFTQCRDGRRLYFIGGDWIIRTTSGLFYPCSAPLFRALFEPVPPTPEEP